jgi:uncharacterized membrane protein YfcA
MIYEIFYFLAVGVFAGLLGGLFGVGGGFIFIPAQLFVYNYFDIPGEIQIKMAIGTSLAAVVFNTLASSYAHYRKNAIHFPFLKKILIGIIIGSLLGSYATKTFPSHLLEIIFGSFECLFGLYFVLSKPVHDSSTIKRFNPLIINAIVSITSALSILLGIGGGIFMIPLLTFLHLPLKQAIGSSSLATLIVAFLGAITLLLPTFSYATVNYAVGYLYLPSFIPLAIGAVAGAPVGAKLTHLLPTRALKKCFGAFLILIGLVILMK